MIWYDNHEDDDDDADDDADDDDDGDDDGCGDDGGDDDDAADDDDAVADDADPTLWPCACRRRFSPLRRREGLRPLPPTSPPRQKPLRFTVFCALPVFCTFSALVAQDGSTWANIGLKMDQHSPNMGQHSAQDGPR